MTVTEAGSGAGDVQPAVEVGAGRGRVATRGRSGFAEPADPAPAISPEGSTAGPSEGRLARIGARFDARPAIPLTAGAVVAAALFLWHLAQAPDVLGDEVVYALAGRNLAQHGTLTWIGTPVYVHPPLFFLLLAGWLRVVGHSGADLLSVITAGRYLNAAISTADVVLVGLLMRVSASRARPSRRGLMTLAAVLLMAIDPLFARFGRVLLLQPEVLGISLVTILVARRLRSAPTSTYVIAVGMLDGVALLSDQVAVFIVLAPLLAGLAARQRTEIRRALAALGVGIVVWASWPGWALVHGQLGTFVHQESVSGQRLLGLLQLTGLNRHGASGSGEFTSTLFQYAGSYVLLAVGGVACLIMILRLRRLSADERLLLAYAFLSYVFLGYSVVFGQFNEQLFFYAIPPAVIMTVVLAAQTLRRPGQVGLIVARLAAVVGLVAGAASWVTVFGAGTDTATAQMETYLSAHIPVCAPVNSTGDSLRWAYTLRTNPVSDYSSGPVAVAAGVHYFLLSPKDAQEDDTPSSPQLEQWIRANGSELASFSSHTYDSIQLWRVGPPVTSAPGVAATCAVPIPTGGSGTSIAPFAVLFGAVLILTGGVGVLWRRARRT